MFAEVLLVKLIARSAICNCLLGDKYDVKKGFRSDKVADFSQNKTTVTSNFDCLNELS